MGIQDSVFGKKVTIEDDFFGTMIFRESKNDSEKNNFECKRHFKPSDSEIEVGILGDQEGPTEIQKGFFKCIEAAYDNVIAASAPLITTKFKNWKEGFEIIDFQKEFIPVYLSLPRCDSNPIVWEIGFKSAHDHNHTFTITYHNFDAIEISIDG